MLYDGILVILGTQFWFLNKAPIIKDNLSECTETLPNFGPFDLVLVEITV